MVVSGCVFVSWLLDSSYSPSPSSDLRGQRSHRLLSTSTDQSGNTHTHTAMTLKSCLLIGRTSLILTQTVISELHQTLFIFQLISVTLTLFSPLSLLSCSDSREVEVEVEEEALPSNPGLESPSCSPLVAPLSSSAALLAGWSSSRQGAELGAAAGRNGLT